MWKREGERDLEGGRREYERGEREKIECNIGRDKSRASERERESESKRERTLQRERLE